MINYLVDYMFNIIEGMAASAFNIPDTTPKIQNMPQATIIYHMLSKGKQLRCRAWNPETKTTCQKQTKNICTKCISSEFPNGTPLCKDICNIRFHNPHLGLIVS